MAIKTKRFLYTILKDIVCQKKGCHAVTGARKVGKTTLFLQLNEYFKDKSTYLNCADGIPYFQSFYEQQIAEGKEIIFLDEICKIGWDDLADFETSTYQYSEKLCILITGNVYGIVWHRGYDIWTGDYYDLPPFLYIEKLCWNHGYDEINIECIKKHTSDGLFKDYLKNQVMSDSELSDYMREVLKDTLAS